MELYDVDITGFARRLRERYLVQQNLDLILLVVLALLAPFLLLPLPWLIRIPLGLGVVFLAPGFALARALFQKDAGFDLVTWIAVSFGLSIATVPVLALVLSLLPFGIQPWSAAVFLSLWILSCCGVAAYRRSQETDYTNQQDIRGIHDHHRALAVHLSSEQVRRFYKLGALAVAIIVGIGTIGLLIPDASQHWTEFYTLGKEGLAENYQVRIHSGQEAQVNLGVTNHEGAKSSYRIEVTDSAGKVLGQDTVEVPAGKTWEGKLSFPLSEAHADQQILIFLYLNDGTTPYRQLSLSLDEP